MLQQDGVVMMVMQVLVAMVMMMMIPMKPSSMTVTMATISLLQEGISPTNFCLSECFLSACFPPCRGGGVFQRSSPQS
jgi:hypothetical protein